jgi:hypothetical protein
MPRRQPGERPNQDGADGGSDDGRRGRGRELEARNAVALTEAGETSEVAIAERGPPGVVVVHELVPVLDVGETH